MSQDLHFGAPFTGQSTPLCARPFLHVHKLPMIECSTRTTVAKYFGLLGHACMHPLTNALATIVVERPSGVARHALCGPARRTTGTILRNTVVTCAHIDWTIAARTQ